MISSKVNRSNPNRRYLIDLVVLTFSVAAFIIMLRPELLVNESLVSVVLFAAFAFAILGLFFWMFRITLEIDEQRQLATKEQLQKLRLKREKLRRQANLKAQLKKPEFAERLQNFTGVQLGDDQELGSNAKSKAEFWRAEWVDFDVKPPRPTEFFRMLLHRISKLVRFAK